MRKKTEMSLSAMNKTNSEHGIKFGHLFGLDLEKTEMQKYHSVDKENLQEQNLLKRGGFGHWVGNAFSPKIKDTNQSKNLENASSKPENTINGQELSENASKSEGETKSTARPTVFVLELSAQDVMIGMGSYISDAVNFLCDTAQPTIDEVVIILTSPGGGVGEYGLAAANLERLKSAGIHLTICVDTVAASGGYMIASVANHLVAAPFSLIGSIGVMGTTLNIHKALKKLGIENYLLTAGKYKAPVGLTNEITKESLEKYQLMINDVQAAFKAHIEKHRPSLDIESVGTGEVWLGLHAIEYKLVDEICTSSQFLRNKMKNAEVIKVSKYTQPKVGLGFMRKALLGPFS
eukprot:CAMPEP_0171452916 /NCGR_PEP_ID=MMETSP0945-20130129/835_1 /TAXON_ID=109269 /ORGANISM="Vaucheria litorea, Strain CCMP2940" /LENGTH=348 /DNA_ID=CAMNT_0011977683 /DNA_START=440 /DNA_END=1483 /DNA_ORIENTATION=+